jgi:hypothetical protein
MKSSNSSFSNAVTCVLAGALFTVGALVYLPWKRGDVAPGPNMATTQENVPGRADLPQ